MCALCRRDENRRNAGDTSRHVCASAFEGVRVELEDFFAPTRTPPQRHIHVPWTLRKSSTPIVSKTSRQDGLYLMRATLFRLMMAPNSCCYGMERAS